MAMCQAAAWTAAECGCDGHWQWTLRYVCRATAGCGVDSACAEPPGDFQSTLYHRDTDALDETRIWGGEAVRQAGKSGILASYRRTRICSGGQLVEAAVAVVMLCCSVPKAAVPEHLGTSEPWQAILCTTWHQCG